MNAASVTGAPQQPAAVLFDFDGTFADTAPDMARALNVLLAQEKRAPITVDSARSYVTRGATGMLDIGFGIGPGHADFVRLRDNFYTVYEHNLCHDTRWFDGMAEVVDVLKENDILWGIVTNKAARFALPLTSQLGISQQAACVVCGDTTSHTKPHPEPLLHAARFIGVAAQDCWYVGDDLRDMQAANAAGMTAIAATYGYLSATADPAQWQARFLVDSPRALIPLITSASRR